LVSGGKGRLLPGVTECQKPLLAGCKERFSQSNHRSTRLIFKHSLPLSSLSQHP